MASHTRARARLGVLLFPLMLVGCKKTSPSDPGLPTLAVTTTAVPVATEGDPYSQVLTATGGDGDYTWGVAASTLPLGMSLSSSGALAGTPSGQGTTFVVQASSGDGQTATRELALDVVMVWDLAEDWSETDNPFGPWSLIAAPGQLFSTSQTDYWDDATGQAAWAAAPFPQLTHVPVWMKVSADHLNLSGVASVGTVIAHTAEPARTGSNRTSVSWVSPVTGTASIDGGVWLRQTLDRPQLWALYVNDVEVTGGRLSQGDGFTESNLYSFSAGTGGAAAATPALAAGDVIELRLVRESSDPAAPGDIVGVSLTILVQTQAGP